MAVQCGPCPQVNAPLITRLDVGGREDKEKKTRLSPTLRKHQLAPAWHPPPSIIVSYGALCVPISFLA